MVAGCERLGEAYSKKPGAETRGWGKGAAFHGRVWTIWTEMDLMDAS